MLIYYSTKLRLIYAIFYLYEELTVFFKSIFEGRSTEASLQ